MVNVYILLLEHKKFYIGKTTNPQFRIEQHFAANGSSWTKKYKPVSVIEVIPDCDEYDEDKYTIKYMEKYGINNVRGGSFCEIKLSDNNKLTLRQMINGVTDKCYICGSVEHFASNCRKKETIQTIDMKEKCKCPTSFFAPHRKFKCMLNKINSLFDDEDDDIDQLILLNVPTLMTTTTTSTKLIDNKQSAPNISVSCCFRCGRKGHYVSNCYAKTHLKGHVLPNTNCLSGTE
jgi:predicted GIY-YIG superfamily endonuclease